MNNSHYQY